MELSTCARVSNAASDTTPKETANFLSRCVFIRRNTAPEATSDMKHMARKQCSRSIRPLGHDGAPPDFAARVDPSGLDGINTLVILYQLALGSNSGLASNGHLTPAVPPLLASAPVWLPEHSRSRPRRDTSGCQAASSRKFAASAVAALLRQLPLHACMSNSDLK